MEKDYLEAISENIRYLLYVNRMSQADVSRKANITQANFSNIITCKVTDIKLSTLVKIAKALNTTIFALLDQKILNDKNK